MFTSTLCICICIFEQALRKLIKAIFDLLPSIIQMNMYKN